MNSINFSLYIHWPFCVQKCSYCDLNSHVRDHIDENLWVSALINEMRTMKKCIPNAKLISIFFGGGTPSLLSALNINLIIQEANKLWQLDLQTEITLETNPSSLETRNLVEFKQAGINRISFGIQSLDNQILKLLNRSHNAEEAMFCIDKAITIFDNISVDIIYALPTQTLTTLQNTFSQLLPKKIQHISIYELTLHQNTKLYNQIEKQELHLPKEDAVSDQYNLILQECERFGYYRYEISSFSKKGYKSIHNTSYWKSRNFIGIGPGAHSRCFISSSNIEDNIFIQQPNDGLDLQTYDHSLKLQRQAAIQKTNSIQYYEIENEKIPEKWLSKVQKLGYGTKNCFVLEQTVQIQEFIMMGLRMTEGIKISDFYKRFNQNLCAVLNSNKIQKLIDYKYLDMDDENIKLTNEGIIRHSAICHYLLFTDN
ncbi:MAG: radical SAM family heme chaperone HemW [Alphaproteobacteria bacterium]|nr:MAG: radical SAM family heme chaperone HemW [Alphaproteobacteria bacterium]